MPEQLSTFKIGDKIGRNKPVATKPQEEEKATAGFPRVEALIDEYQTAAQAKETFADSIARLEGLLAVEKNPKKKAEIVKAKKAFEHSMATLDYLFQVRGELATQAQPAAKTKKK